MLDIQQTDQYTDNTHFYIYLVDQDCTNNKPTTSCTNISLPPQRLRIIKNKLKFTPTKNYVSYTYRNMVYKYEIETDNQVCIKTSSSSLDFPQNYPCLIHRCEEAKVPFYLFPSTNKIDFKSSYKLEEYKINNRIHLVIKTGNDGNQCAYIHYRHSKNADIDNCNKLILNLLDVLLEPI